MIHNIDVTLRDGGYQNNFNFPKEYSVSHVQALIESGIEWIEIDYRNGYFKSIANIGLIGLPPDSYIQAIYDAA